MSDKDSFILVHSSSRTEGIPTSAQTYLAVYLGGGIQDLQEAYAKASVNNHIVENPELVEKRWAAIKEAKRLIDALLTNGGIVSRSGKIYAIGQVFGDSQERVTTEGITHVKANNLGEYGQNLQTLMQPGKREVLYGNYIAGITDTPYDPKNSPANILFLLAPGLQERIFFEIVPPAKLTTTQGYRIGREFAPKPWLMRKEFQNGQEVYVPVITLGGSTSSFRDGALTNLVADMYLASGIPAKGSVIPPSTAAHAILHDLCYFDDSRKVTIASRRNTPRD